MFTALLSISMRIFGIILRLLLLNVGASSSAWIGRDSFVGKGNRFRVPSVRSILGETTTVLSESKRHYVRLDSGKDIPIRPRRVNIDDEWTATVWELEDAHEAVEGFWSATMQPNRREALLDPFGFVTWPGSVLASRELIQHRLLVANKTVFILGAGVGIEAQVSAYLGATSVLATDIHPTTLKLLAFGADQAGLSDQVSSQVFDIASTDPLPKCDIMVIADVLYNEQLAGHVARRCLEALKVPNPPIILLSDSQKYVPQFEDDLNRKLCSIGMDAVRWQVRELKAFTGSGVIIAGDQTYDISGRVLWIPGVPQTVQSIS